MVVLAVDAAGAVGAEVLRCGQTLEVGGVDGGDAAQGVDASDLGDADVVGAADGAAGAGGEVRAGLEFLQALGVVDAVLIDGHGLAAGGLGSAIEAFGDGAQLAPELVLIDAHVGADLDACAAARLAVDEGDGFGGDFTGRWGRATDGVAVGAGVVGAGVGDAAGEVAVGADGLGAVGAKLARLAAEVVELPARGQAVGAGEVQRQAEARVEGLAFRMTQGIGARGGVQARHHRDARAAHAGGDGLGRGGRGVAAGAASTREDGIPACTRASRLVEPALLFLVALIVGLIVVMMYMPIFDIASSIR
jgi:hypothetical protein